MTVLTAAEVAEILKVTASYVYAQAKRGNIPYFMAGNRSVRFVKEDIEEWIRSGGAKKGEGA